MENQIYLKIIGALSPFIFGIIGYFIKKMMNSHDRHTEKINDIEKNYVKKEELDLKEKDLKKEIKESTEDKIRYVKEDIEEVKKLADSTSEKTMNAINELKEEIKKVQLEYINKEDFFQTTAKLSSQMEKLTDMFIEIKQSSK